MKKLLYSLVLLFFFVNTYAQLPPNSIAQNFAYTDVNANTHVLYDYLNTGKPVVLAAFEKAEPGSWFVLDGLSAAYDAYGPNGDNSVIFLAIETSDIPDTEITEATDNIIPGTTWSDHIDYPIVNESQSFGTAFQVDFVPLIYIVYPNRITNVLNADDLIDNAVTTVGAAADPSNYDVAVGQNNVGIVEYTGASTYCGSFAPSFTIQNLGLQTLTSFVAVLQEGDGTLINSINWTGALAPYDLATIDFPEIGNGQVYNLKLLVSNPNDAGDDDLENNTLETVVGTAPIVGVEGLEIFAVTDAFANNESSWQILNLSTGNFHSASSFMSNTDQTFSVDFAEEGCYSLVISDVGGDGLGETLEVRSNGVVIFDNPDIGLGVQIIFEVKLSADLPTADFGSDVNDGGLMTVFGNSDDDIANWEWNFGDGQTGEGQTTTHQYTSNGTYQVILTVTDINGEMATIIHPVTVSVAATSNFIFSQGGQSNAEVAFTDASTFAEQWVWSFGDGNNSFEANPTHTYTENGTYNVCMIASNADFPQGVEICQEVIVTDAVGIDDLQLLEEITLAPTLVQDKLTLTFSINEMPENLHFYVCDINGKVVENIFYQVNYGQNKIDINTTNYTSGLYLFVVEENKNRTGLKFLVD